MLRQTLDVGLAVFTLLEDVTTDHLTLTQHTLAAFPHRSDRGTASFRAVLAVKFDHFAVELVPDIVVLQDSLHGGEILQLWLLLELCAQQFRHLVHIVELGPRRHFFLVRIQAHISIQVWRHELYISSRLQVLLVRDLVELASEVGKSPLTLFG